MDTQVPVLTYHCIAEEPYSENSELFVRPEDFARQLDILAEEGYTSIFADELHNSAAKKPVVITFDDGYEDNYFTAFPILKEKGQKATIFVISGMIGREGYLTVDEIREMVDSGFVSIQSHTDSHRMLTGLSLDDRIREFATSKSVLEAASGREVTAVAYPFGDVDYSVLQAAEEFYDFGYITTGRYIPFMDMRVPRVTVNRSTTEDGFRALIK